MTGLNETPESSVSLRRIFAFSLAVLALFALNLFYLQPLLSEWIGPRAAQMTYIGIRIVGLLGLAYALAKWAGRNRFQTVTTVLLIGCIDQVFLKGLWIRKDMMIHPEAWTGIEPANSVIFLNMALGYLFFIPIVLILSFVGMEATRFRRDWRA